MDISLYEAGLPNTLLSQHYNFGIHSDGTHGHWVWKSPGLESTREAVGGGQFTSYLCSEKINDEFCFSAKEEIESQKQHSNLCKISII